MLYIVYRNALAKVLVLLRSNPRIKLLGAVVTLSKPLLFAPIGEVLIAP